MPYPFTKCLLVFNLLVAAGTTVVAQSDSVDLTDALALAEVWLEAEQDYHDLPGIAAAIVRDQDIVWSGAFGHADVEANTPLTPDTQFHIASISKTFAAVATMTLVDAGKLRLDDRVANVLPWFQPPPHDGDNAPITIRSLLTHSSGLTREIEAAFWEDIARLPVGEAMRTELGTAPPLYPSSTYFQYSNVAFMVLGEVVSEVSGMPYVDYLRQHVLDPLGLDRTVASYPASDYGKTHAVGYSPVTRDRTYHRLSNSPSAGIASMGGLSSTVLDLADYARWQFRLYDAAAEPEVLRPSTLRQMHRVHFTDADWKRTWGLGFAVSKGPDESTFVGHGGHLPGHMSHFLLHPASKIAYVVMSNTSGVNPRTYTQGLMKLVTKAKAVPANAEHRLPRERLTEYAGTYHWADNLEEYYISPWEGRLAVLSLPADDPSENMEVFEHLEGDTFRRVRDDGGYGETLEFTRNDGGRITQGRTFNYVFRRQ